MSEPEFCYRVCGKTVPLQPVRTARLVSPARGCHPAVVAARLARSSRLSLDGAMPRGYLLIRGDEAKLEEVRGYADVRGTRGVFTDPGGHEMILTDQVIVRFRPRTSDKTRRRLCERFGSQVLAPDRNVALLRVRDDADDAPLTVANLLAEERGVESAEPNALTMPSFAGVDVSTEPLFPDQWHLQNTGQGDGEPGADVAALAAWEYGFGSPDIRVVVHDTGVDSRHPDLALNLDPGLDTEEGDSDASPSPFGIKPAHGTACAGVIAAARTGSGTLGIAPGCRIVPIRVQVPLLLTTLADTVRWAGQHGDILCCAWSMAESAEMSFAVREVAEYGRGGRGMPVLCAVGKDGEPLIRFPASMPETIAIGASTNRDRRAGYSPFGDGLDVLAPSSGGSRRIATTDIVGPDGFNMNDDGDYCEADKSSGFGGTSAATSLASGVVALMLSANPDLSAEEVREILRATAERISPVEANYDASGRSLQYGSGRIHAGRAVEEARRRRS